MSTTELIGYAMIGESQIGAIFFDSDATGEAGFDSSDWETHNSLRYVGCWDDSTDTYISNVGCTAARTGDDPINNPIFGGTNPRWPSPWQHSPYPVPWFPWRESYPTAPCSDPTNIDFGGQPAQPPLFPSPWPGNGAPPNPTEWPCSFPGAPPIPPLNPETDPSGHHRTSGTSGISQNYCETFNAEVGHS